MYNNCTENLQFPRRFLGDPMKPTPPENPAAFIAGMLGSLYKNPGGYVQTVGELNALIWFVHHLWAEIADRGPEFIEVRCKWYDQNFADDIEKSRAAPITNEQAASRVTTLWKAIDSAVQLDTDPDQFRMNHE
jgi:hypothetical protein